MRLLLDTHILVWLMMDDKRLSKTQRNAIETPSNFLFVSAVAAYEYSHLQADQRIPIAEDIDFVVRHLGCDVLDLPAQCWRAISDLPMIHRDPVDRLQIAHCLASNLILVTADRHIRQYPIDTI